MLTNISSFRSIPILVIPRLDRGIQKGTGCPLKTCGYDAETVTEFYNNETYGYFALLVGRFLPLACDEPLCPRESGEIYPPLFGPLPWRNTLQPSFPIRFFPKGYRLTRLL